jgi:hypothetical protein
VRDPEVFLAHAPRGAGLRCALVYLKGARDVYGWFTGRRDDATPASGYFLLEGFYANAPTRYEEAQELHSDWTLDEGRRHQLARVQDAFAREWLVAGQDAASVRPERLTHFSTLQPNWTHYSPRFERAVLNALSKRWPLDYRPDDD